MKRLNKLFMMISLGFAALLMTSEVMAAGADASTIKKHDSIEVVPLDSFSSDIDGKIGAGIGADPSDRHRHDHNRCEVRNREGVPCSDGFCDVRAGGEGGRGEHNNDSKLCKGHGGVASPS